MHFKAVFRAAKALQSAGLAALRFNFRASAAARAFTTTASASRRTRAPRFRRCSGASPGCRSSSAASRSAPSWRCASPHATPACAPCSPSASRSSASATPRRFGRLSQPRLFVQGEHDPFGAGEALRAIVEPLPPPRELVIVQAANHFFDGQLDALQGAVADWAERRPWDAAAR